MPTSPASNPQMQSWELSVSAGPLSGLPDLSTLYRGDKSFTFPLEMQTRLRGPSKMCLLGSPDLRWRQVKDRGSLPVRGRLRRGECRGGGHCSRPCSALLRAGKGALGNGKRPSLGPPSVTAPGHRPSEGHQRKHQVFPVAQVTPFPTSRSLPFLMVVFLNVPPTSLV